MNYDIYMQKAMRQVVHDILETVSQEGLEGDSYYMITFETNRKDVIIPDFVRASYPDEITIVLQYQFEDLTVSKQFFEVELTFGGVPSRLHIPFNAIKQFADPSQRFAIVLKTIPEEKESFEYSEEDAKKGACVIDINSLRRK